MSEKPTKKKKKEKTLERKSNIPARRPPPSVNQTSHFAVVVRIRYDNLLLLFYCYSIATRLIVIIIIIIQTRDQTVYLGTQGCLLFFYSLIKNVEIITECLTNRASAHVKVVVCYWYEMGSYYCFRNCCKNIIVLIYGIN